MKILSYGAGVQSTALVIQFFKMLHHTPGCSSGYTPSGGKIIVAKQGISSAVAQVHYRPYIGPFYIRIVVDCGDPHIQQHIHFRTALIGDKLFSQHNRDKEKTGLLLTGAGVVQHCIVFSPITDGVLDNLIPRHSGIGNQMVLL